MGIAQSLHSERVLVMVCPHTWEISITCSLLKIYNKRLKYIASWSLITKQHPAYLALSRIRIALFSNPPILSLHHQIWSTIIFISFSLGKWFLTLFYCNCPFMYFISCIFHIRHLTIPSPPQQMVCRESKLHITYMVVKLIHKLNSQ